MISDYFFIKKTNDDKATEIVAKRIEDVKNYISNWLLKMPADNYWYTATIYDVGIINGLYAHSNDRYYISTKLFELMKSNWIETTKVKIEDFDWKYLIYQVVKSFGYKVNYADGTLSICQDIPPVCSVIHCERLVKPKWLR